MEALSICNQSLASRGAPITDHQTQSRNGFYGSERERERQREERGRETERERERDRQRDRVIHYDDRA